MITEIQIEIGGTDFIISNGLVQEWGTTRCYDPATGKGYILDGDRHISLLSYGNFGNDSTQAQQGAENWCRKAHEAWNIATKKEKAMTNIVNISTDEITEAECIVDGTDILADVMGGSGIDSDDRGYLLPDADQVEWWLRWAQREERICAAYAEADEDTRKAYEEAIIGNGHDLELLQDVQERVLGI